MKLASALQFEGLQPEGKKTFDESDLLFNWKVRSSQQMGSSRLRSEPARVLRLGWLERPGPVGMFMFVAGLCL